MNARDVIGKALEFDPLGPAPLHFEPIDLVLSALAAAGLAIYDTRTHAGVPREQAQWQPIETAIEIAKTNDGWIPASLFAIRREHGWEQWVGQCDAGNIWLGREDTGACFDTVVPSHWRPLPDPPAAETEAKETGDA